MKTTDMAMFESSFPVNPLPFLLDLAEGCKAEGSDFITTDKAKRILFVINALAYGQLFHIDSYKEFQRLKDSARIEF